MKEPAPDRETGLAKLLARFQAEASVSYRKFAGPMSWPADDLAALLSERFGAVPSRLTAAAAVAALLRRGVRLVTITGTGGVGKSRLAVMVALELVAEDLGEVYFTPLSDARQALVHLGYDVLATTLPRLEVYAQSFGMLVPETGCGMWRRWPAS